MQEKQMTYLNHKSNVQKTENVDHDTKHKPYEVYECNFEDCVIVGHSQQNVIDDIESFDLKKIEICTSTIILGENTPSKFNLIQNILVENIDKYDQCFVLGFPSFVNSEFEKIVGKKNIFQYGEQSSMILNDLIKEHNKKTTLLIMHQPVNQKDAKRIHTLYRFCGTSVVTDFEMISKDSVNCFRMCDYSFIMSKKSIGTYFDGCSEIKSYSIISSEQNWKQFESENMAIVLKINYRQDNDVFKYNLSIEPKKKIESCELLNSIQHIAKMLEMINERIDAIEKVVTQC